MLHRQRVLKHLTIPKFKVLDEEHSEDEHIERNFSFTSPNLSDLLDNKALSSNLNNIAKLRFDDLTTPNFNSNSFIFNETKKTEALDTEEYENENDRARKVKVTLCVNTDKINNAKLLDTSQADWVGYTADETLLKQSFCLKKSYCQCLVI
ncbi:hypothetical protein SteCoe_14081 [Stentor coeruleus]|uniref:Uncharacterized protein n=1 Tax=Stentor coeruleus TaxID=5963 RepID=A0A1R2C6Z2_9CILI|nr:hypothetical protein SteCoe_14081 [Stentor coeruleus]